MTPASVGGGGGLEVDLVAAFSSSEDKHMNDNTPPIGADDDTPCSLYSEAAARQATQGETMRTGARKNPEKTSDKPKGLRDGDDFFRYAGEADTWEIPWGTK